MFPKRRKHLALCGALLACAALPSVQAVEYSFSPRVLQRFGYDDNLQLINEQGAVETPLYELRPGILFRARGDNWQIEADAAVEFERFNVDFANDVEGRSIDSDSFDTDNQRGRFSISRFSERQVFQLDFRINREAQRTAGELEAGILAATRTEDIFVRPSYQRQLNERLRLSVGGTFQNRHFDFLGLSDYEVTGLDASLTRQMNQTTSLSLTGFVQDFVAETRSSPPCNLPFFGTITCAFFDSRRETTTLGLQLGWRKFISERLEVNLSAGGRNVDAGNVYTNAFGSAPNRNGLLCVIFNSPFGGAQPVTPCGPLPEFEDSSTSSGLLASSSVTYRGERITHNVSLERSVSPVGLGFLVETDLVRGTSTYEFSPRLKGTLDLRVLRSSSVADPDIDGFTFDREFFSVDVSFAWRLSENWSVGPGIRYRDQESVFNNIDASATQVYLNLAYRPQTLKVAR